MLSGELATLLSGRYVNFEIFPFSFKEFSGITKQEINKETLEFENINHYEHKNSDKYLFYSDVVLKGINTNDKTFSNFNLYFNEEGNYCPSCKNKTLAFRVIIYVD